jgi:hypothetical protein
MAARIRIAVIVPAGPRDDVLDTLASVVHYTDRSRVIVVIDDTAGARGGLSGIRDLSPDIAVLPPPPRAPGGLGGLWVKIASGYRWLLERYEPQTILRLDADALLIGQGLESCAEAAFRDRPAVGLLGSYRTDPAGEQRDWSWAASRLGVETGLRGWRHPARRSQLRQFLTAARAHGYQDGENVLGGAYLHSYQAAQHIQASGWFDRPELATSRLGEDHIMSLITRAAGFGLAELGGPQGPLAVKWKGLSAHPADLLASRKLVVHSVRSWPGLSEAEIRRTFQQARARDKASR